MDTLLKWLSFVILRTSTHPIKLTFRKIEIVAIKLVKMEEPLSFNETCAINNLLPTYTILLPTYTISSD